MVARTAACMALVLLLAAPAAAESRFPQLHPFSSAADGVAFAVQSGCLPFLAEGGAIHDRVHRSGRPGEIDGRRANRLYGRGDVQIQEDARGGCFVVASRADANELRQTVLDAMSRAGYPTTAVQDSGPGSRDSSGSFRQESHCFLIAGKPGAMVMSTSTNPRRPALQLSMLKDTDGPCAEIVASGQSFEAYVAARRQEREETIVQRFATLTRACRAIVGGAAVEESVRTAEVTLRPPQALANTGWADASFGSTAFFGADSPVRVSVNTARAGPVYFLVNDSGTRCQVVAGAAPHLTEHISRALADADWTLAGAGEFRRANGDAMRIQMTPRPEGLVIVSATLSRRAQP